MICDRVVVIVYIGISCVMIDLLYVRMFLCCCVFFFKQKTAYEMRISDWSSDVCSSDLLVVTLFDKILIRLEAFLDVTQRKPRPFVLSDADRKEKLGRASCRERVCQYV